MKYVYVFMCTANKNLLVFTCNNTGKYLPSNLCNGSWQLFKEIELTKESKRIMGANPKEILEGIANDGYFLNLTPFQFFDIAA